MDVEQTQARRWQLLARMDEDEFEAEPAACWRGRLRAASRNGIGARVAVKAGGVVQTDEVRSGGSYISHNDMRLHFGLGEATRVESIEVRWPAGGTETFGPFEVNREVLVEEGGAHRQPALETASGPSTSRIRTISGRLEEFAGFCLTSAFSSWYTRAILLRLNL